MDDCDVTAAMERRRSQRVVDRIMRSLSPHALLLVNWFIWHHSDHELQELVHFSAELWAWEEEYLAVDADRMLWMLDEDDDGPELPDLSEHLRSISRSLLSEEDLLVGYDAGDGV